MLSFISILLIICFPNVSNKTYHDTGYNKLYAETMGVLVSIILCHLMDHLHPKTGNTLAIFVLYILLMVCLPNISNKFYHGKKEDQLYAQHKRRTSECFLGEHCVISWSRYVLKWGIPWNFLFISILLISCLPNVSKNPIMTHIRINFLKNI